MRALNFWTFVWRCVDQAASDTIHFFGWDVKTVLTTVVLVGLGFVLYWRVKGSSETTEEIFKYVVITAVPPLLFAAGLFLYSAFRAPYFVYLAEYKKVQEHVETAEARIKDLEKELKEKSSSHVAQAGKVPQHPREPTTQVGAEPQRKREIRDKLGMFLEQGRVLAAKCQEENKPVPETEANAWAANTENYLRQVLGEGYVARFRNSAGLPLMVTSIQEPQHRNLWSGISIRNARLAEFIAELRD
jgi:hypothetical protein